MRRRHLFLARLLEHEHEDINANTNINITEEMVVVDVI